MANENNLAHPYADALFALAKESDTTDSWLLILEQLASIAKNEEFTSLINNPNMSKKSVLEVLLSFIKKPTNSLDQFLLLSQENNRLQVLPEIYALFKHKVEEDRNTAKALVLSAYPIEDESKEKIERSLSKKFGKTIYVNVEVEPNLIGGIKVLINDLVIDYSVKGSLENLTTQLIS